MKRTKDGLYVNGVTILPRNEREERFLRILEATYYDVKRTYKEGLIYTAEYYLNELNGMLSACYFLHMSREPISCLYLDKVLNDEYEIRTIRCVTIVSRETI